MSDNFNSENGGVGQLGYNGFANFIGNNVDLIGNGFFDYMPGNGLYVDLSGTGAGSLQSRTNFTLGPGVYELKFDLGNPDRTASGYFTVNDNATVSLGSVYSENFKLPVADAFIQITRDVTILTPTTGFLTFADHSNTSAGDYLDNVSLTRTSAPVPEASTTVSLGLLLALGLGGVVVARRRRKA